MTLLGSPDSMFTVLAAAYGYVLAGKADFKVEVTQSGIVAFRYAPIS